MQITRFSLRSAALVLVNLLLVSCIESSVITESESTYHIPKTTQFTLNLEVPLSSNANKRGDTFKTVLKLPLKLGESVILPENTVINGLVKNASIYKKFGDRASLALIFDQIVLANGTELPIVASIDTRSGSVPIRIEGQALKQTKVLLNTAVMGALLENPSDAHSIGEEGLLLGAMVGTGAVLLSNAREVKLPVGTELVISLEQDLKIPKK